MAATAVVVLATGCGGGGGTGGGAGTGGGPPPSGYAVVVSAGGVEQARFDLSALRALPQVRVETPGTGGDGVQEGPSVAEVLNRARVPDPAGLTVTGDEGTVTFTAAEIAGTVLDFTNRDTVKLAGADLPRERWIRNVTVLDVG